MRKTCWTTSDKRQKEEMPMIDFTEEELYRYSRHILLPDIGAEGQERIRQGRVLVVGAGGLGAPVLLYLAAAGVGTIGIVDGDVVELSNLQRQVIHFTADTGHPKTESARQKIRQLNPHVQVDAYDEFLTADNAEELIGAYDFVVDGTDNFAVKFLINDTCVRTGKPFSHGSLLRYEGQTFTHVPGSACYRCLFTAPPPEGSVPTCSQAGVLGAVVGTIGTIQATEVLKYLTGTGQLLTDCLLTFNAQSMDFQKLTTSRNSDCPVCGDRPTLTELTGGEPPACHLSRHRRP